MILSNNIFKKSIIAIILLFSIAFIINFSYLRKINIYEPVSISFPNLNVGQKKRINVYGLSILKRKLPFYYDNSSQSWKHFYCFQHSLYITINDTFKFTKPIINLTIGNNSMRLDSRDFIQIEKQTGTNGFQIYNKRQNGFNYLKMIRSVFYWTVTRKLIIWFLWVLFFPLFCFVLIKYRKRISSFIVKIFVSFKLLLIRFITFSEKKTIHTVETIRNFNKHIVGKIHFCHHTFVNFQERFVLSSKGKLLAFGFFLNALIKGISESKNYKRICRIILNIIAYLKLRVLKKKWLRTSLKIAFIIFLIINLLLYSSL